jgi:hypothetical protein
MNNNHGSLIPKDELKAWQEISTLFSNADDSNEAIARGLKETGYSIDELTQLYEEKICPIFWTIPWLSIPPWYFSRESIEKKINQSKNSSNLMPIWIRKAYIRLVTSYTRKDWNEVVSYLKKLGVPQSIENG